jgi:hypothetical protein
MTKGKDESRKTPHGVFSSTLLVTIPPMSIKNE